MTNYSLINLIIDMQKVVFDLLIREKLSANNEFVIFMMLWGTNCINELSSTDDWQNGIARLVSKA